MAVVPLLRRSLAQSALAATTVAVGLTASACSFSLGTDSGDEPTAGPDQAETRAPVAGGDADAAKESFGRQAEPEPIEANEVSAFKLRVGDCLAESSTESQVESVGVVPCAAPHGREVYALVDLPDGPFPAEEQLIEQVEAECYDEFEPFVGIDYLDSRYYMSYLYPTESSWADGDREVVCMLFDPEGEMTGTARDAAE
ncbi:septum formation family protein [Lolliginicoccus suaedae]|uniref:septum formation family protein n=1 Tax=Lolliginicoccus suaedae TaxID=2605429 RepID=UPI0011EF6FCA|nr:septum formation family protein [Lolliginicoccus suaedae]